MPNYFDTADAIVSYLVDRSFSGRIDDDAADYFENEEWAGFHIWATVDTDYNGTIAITSPEGDTYEWELWVDTFFDTISCELSRN